MRRSVSSARPGGWKALFLLLGEQGIRAEKVESEPRLWPADLPVMVSAQEYVSETWDDNEAKAALHWVASGHTLILLTAGSDELLQRIGLSARPGSGRNATLFPLQPAPYLAGVDGVTVPSSDRFEKLPVSGVPLFADPRPAAVAIRHEKGIILALSDPGIADNRHIALTDNARFLTAAIGSYAGSSRRVGFDEYHQGFYTTDDSLWTAIGRPGQFVSWQLLALALLIAYSCSRRFGLPRPLPAPSRVSSEYVASLADLYRRARAADAALEGVYLSFWRDLCRAVSLPFDTPTEDVVRRAARTLAPGNAVEIEERLRRVVNDCEGKIEQGTVQDSDLLPLARELEQLRRDLELGGHDG